MKKSGIILALCLLFLTFVIVSESRAGSSQDQQIFLPIIASPPFMIADFNTCVGVNNLGGQMGAAYILPDLLQESFIVDKDAPGRGCIARLHYNNPQAWSAFWLKLQELNVGSYTTLSFDIRSEGPPPNSVKLELKRGCNAQTFVCDEVWIKDVAVVTSDWQQVNMNLNEFVPFDDETAVPCFEAMEELVFTFELAKSGAEGIVYLDNIILTGEPLSCPP
jgi:hypothetical protein